MIRQNNKAARRLARKFHKLHIFFVTKFKKGIDNIRFINEQYYGEHSPELYPVYERVYDWYHTARPLDVKESEYRDYLQLIEVTQAMVDIQEKGPGLTLPQAALAYRRLAESHFEAMRFAMAEDEWVDPRIIVASDVPYRVTPGFEDLSMREHYMEGRDAFRKVPGSEDAL